MNLYWATSQRHDYAANHSAVIVAFARAVLALAAPADDKEVSRFLSDVMTAAGLVEHGKQSKALAERLAEGCAKYRTALAAPAVQAEPVAWAATSEDGEVEALGMNQSRRFDTPLYFGSAPAAQSAKEGKHDRR